MAMLTFCCLTEHQRTVLTQDELHRLVPHARHASYRAPYYLDRFEDTPRLGFLRVDIGGRGRWDRIIAKCLHDIYEHAQSAAWQPLIQQQQFEITVVTALAQKADRIRSLLAEQAPQLPVPLRIVALPNLFHLMALLPAD
jgi:hypothetical protein